MELATRRDAAAVAAARAAAAGAEQAKTRKQLGQLAGDLYRNGGLNPALSSFVSGSGRALEDAATLEAVTAGRARAFESAENAATAAQSLTEAAADANRAADEAAATAADRKADADRAAAAQRQVVADAKAQRSALVDQLASLRNTTAALESARVDALDRQRQQARLAALTAAAGPAPQPGTGSQPAPTAHRDGTIRPQDSQPLRLPPTCRPPLQRPHPHRHPHQRRPHPRRLRHPRRIPRQYLLRSPHRFLPRFRRQYLFRFRRRFLAGQTRPRFRWRSARPDRHSSTSTAEPGAYGFDCSGLVQNAFAAAGKYLPRTASQQFAQAPVHVPLSQARPGDLLVWGSAPGFYHVAIYLGGGRVVQALNPDAGITVTDVAAMSGMQLYGYAARY